MSLTTGKVSKASRNFIVNKENNRATNVGFGELRFEADRNLETGPFPAMQGHVVMGETIYIRQQAGLSIKMMASPEFPNSPANIAIAVGR